MKHKRHVCLLACLQEVAQGKSLAQMIQDGMRADDAEVRHACTTSTSCMRDGAEVQHMHALQALAHEHEHNRKNGLALPMIKLQYWQTNKIGK